MDVLTFIKKMDIDDFKSGVVDFFDENMAMFSMIGHYADINVSAIYDEVHIKYNVSQDKNNNLELLIRTLKSCSIYDRNFDISITEVNKDCLIIELHEASRKS